MNQTPSGSPALIPYPSLAGNVAGDCANGLSTVYRIKGGFSSWKRQEISIEDLKLNFLEYSQPTNAAASGFSTPELLVSETPPKMSAHMP